MYIFYVLDMISYAGLQADKSGVGSGELQSGLEGVEESSHREYYHVR